MLRSSLSGEIKVYKTVFLERKPENLVRGGEDSRGKRSNFLDFSLLRLASLI